MVSNTMKPVKYYKTFMAINQVLPHFVTTYLLTYVIYRYQIPIILRTPDIDEIVSVKGNSEIRHISRMQTQ